MRSPAVSSRRAMTAMFARLARLVAFDRGNAPSFLVEIGQRTQITCPHRSSGELQREESLHQRTSMLKTDFE